MTYKPIDYWDDRYKKHGVKHSTSGNISYSDQYNSWIFKRKREVMENILSNIKPQTSSILDIGCGSGYWIDYFLKKEFYLIRGIDISNIATKHLSKQYKPYKHVSFECLNVSIPDLSPLPSFDIVNAWDIIFHIIEDDKAINAIKFMHGSLTKYGILILTDQLGRDYNALNSEHVRVRCLNFYNNEMPNLGFELLKTYPLFEKLNYNVTTVEIDNTMGFQYYLNDTKLTKMAKDNTSVAVFRKKFNT